MTDTVLSAEQIESFVEHGYVTIPDCFSREDAQPWLDEAWVRLGYDRDDPDDLGRAARPHAEPAPREVADFAPKVWRAACQLLGGEERIEQPYTWGNGFIANLGLGADRPWEPPSASSPGWHKDGDFFRHFLDSPEQGLLTIVLWSDIEERGGGTFVAPDSVAPVARLLEPSARGRAARRLPLRRADRAVLDLRRDHRPPGRRRAHASLHAPRGLPEPPRDGALHHEPADRAEGADALRPRRPRRALPGRARRAARPGRRARSTTGPRPRARTSCPSACAARSACASEEEARLAEASS